MFGIYRVLVIRLECLSAQLDSAPAMRFGQGVFTNKAVSSAEVFPGDGFGSRPALKALANFSGSIVQRSPHRRVDSQTPVPALRPGGREHIVHQELAEGLGVGFGL